MINTIIESIILFGILIMYFICKKPNKTLKEEVNKLYSKQYEETEKIKEEMNKLFSKQYEETEKVKEVIDELIKRLEE